MSWIPVKSINFYILGVSYCGKGRSTHDDTIIVTFLFWNLLFSRGTFGVSLFIVGDFRCN